MLSRTIWAARIDLQIALFATLVPARVRHPDRRADRLFRRLADAVFRRLVDVVITIPFIVLVIAIVAVLGPGLVNMYIAISAVGLDRLCPADAGRGHGAESSATTPPPAG